MRIVRYNTVKAGAQAVMESRRNKIAEDERCDFATLNFILYEKSIKRFDSFAHTFLTFLLVKFNDSFALNEHRLCRF